MAITTSSVIYTKQELQVLADDLALNIGLTLFSEQCMALLRSILNSDFEEESLLLEMSINPRLKLARSVMYDFSIVEMPLHINFEEAPVIQRIAVWRLKIAK